MSEEEKRMQTNVLKDVDRVEIPLFPLHAAFNSGQKLALRIFEPRYREMIKQVAGKKEAFGIVQILSGHEVGPTPTIASHGVMASIIDFETLPDGLLGITIFGERPFVVDNTRIQEDGLMIGLVVPFLQSKNASSGKTDYEHAGPMDYEVANGLGVPVEEYVQALLGKRVQTERLEAGTVVDGVKLVRTRVIFRYQGQTTFIDLDE